MCMYLKTKIFKKVHKPKETASKILVNTVSITLHNVWFQYVLVEEEMLEMIK